MLIYAAIINDIILVPIVVLIMRIANDKQIRSNRVDYFLILFYDRNYCYNFMFSNNFLVVKITMIQLFYVYKKN
jgi:hypothetical protein